MASSLRRRLLAIDGVVESESMFSERPALWVNGKEIVHRNDNGAYDVRLGRQAIRRMGNRLRADPRVHLRASSSSDWVEIEVTDVAGEEALVELVTAAAQTHSPPPGEALRPPPRGEELARRRHFH